MCFLRGLWALALFMHLRLLEFGDGDYAGHRLLNRIAYDCFDGGIRRSHFFRAGFFAPARLGLSFVKRFFGVVLAALRFADFLRLDLEALRTLPRAVGVPFLTVARFFPLGHDRHLFVRAPQNALCKQPRQAKGVRTDLSAHQALSGGGSLIGGPTIPAHLPRKRHRNALASADQCLSS